ncbi:efflux RND transporter permease subunit [Athalassotoga saccharophila]|uniref:efflux RND transporter permease subunit n=1 Tax=Athalassotoga saccharophila TaxID=1441386 RepID=UPI00137996BD|nr:MMPL family transporter [Athalassotoga saccharophila]BBJ28633.1 trehalose monomycolate exporter MmpL3 [Athalassotoga saccharophila]
MPKLGTWIAKHRILIIVLFVGVTIFMGYQAMKIKIVDDITTYVPQNNPENLFLKNVLDNFKMNNLVLVGLEYKDLFSKSSIQNISDLTNGLSKMKDVTSVMSLTNAPWITNVNGSMEISTISKSIPQTSNQSAALEYEVTHSPIFKGQFVSPNGKSTIILVGLPNFTNPASSISITKKIETFIKNNSTAEKIYFSGLSPSDVYAQSIAIHNISILIPLALLAIALVLLLSFRNLIGFALPLISVIMSSIWVLGTIHLLGMTMTLADVAMPIIVIALGNAYGIYIVNKYMEEGDSDHVVRTSNTLRDIGIAISLSAFTVIIAFLSLLTVGIDPIRYFGIFTALGIFYALIINIIFTPAVSSFYCKNVSQSKGEISFWSKIAKNILKHRLSSMIIAIAIVAGISIFIYKVSPDMSLNKLVGNNNSIGHSMNFFNDQFGGSDFVIVDFKGNALDPYLLRSEILISNYAENNFKVVGGSYSLARVIQNMNDKFNGQNYIPSSDSKIQNLWFLMKGSNLSEIVNSGATESIVLLRVNVESSKKIKALQDSLTDFINSNIYKRYSYVNLDSASPVEVKSAILSMENYVTDYMKSLNLDYNSTDIDSIVSRILLSSNETVLSKDATNLVNYLTDMIGSYGMISGFSTSDLRMALLDTFKEGYSNKTLEDNLNSKIGPDNTSMISPVIESQDSVLAQIARKDYAKSLLSNVKGLSDEEVNNLSWTLSSRKIPVYDPNGSNSFDVKLTGVPILTNYVSSIIINDQCESMIISIILVFVLLMIQTNSWLMGLIGIFPVLLTMIVNFGIMGIFGISLNAINITIASMTVGVGVDYVIQIFSRFRIEYGRSNGISDAIIKTFSTSGKGLLLNSISSSAGFAMFFFSTIGGLKQFAILTISTMIISLVLVIILLPSLLSFLREDFLNKKFKKERVK